MSSSIEKQTLDAAAGTVPATLAYSHITTNTTTVLVTGVAGKSIRVRGIFVSYSTVALSSLTFKDGSTARILINCPLTAVALAGDNCPNPIPPNCTWQLAAAADLNCVSAGLSSGLVDITVFYDLV